jgi:crotonobetainyl-CoA:carnitine CoA-transferase CaiB-like acyl-CoA transferase
MPGFGLDGPWRDRIGFAQTMEMLSGMAWVTGFPDGPPVVPRGPGDPLAGLHATFAVLSALELAQRTGEPQLVEVAMIEAALNATAEQHVEHSAYGRLVEREGNRGPAAAPQNVYACAGEEEWLALAVADDAQWDALVDVLGRPDWSSDPRFATSAGRRAAHDDLDGHLSAWCAAQDLDDVVERLAAAGVPAARVILPPDIVDNPQLRARGFFEEMQHPVTGPNLYSGLPMRLSRGPRRWNRTTTPTLGEHNDEVLGGDLGLGDDERARLRADDVIAETLRMG